MLRVPVILCFLAASSFGPSAEAAAVCDEARFDEVAGNLLLYANNELQPETSKTLTETCVKDNKTFTWIEDYSKECIKGIAGGVMRLLLDSSGEELHNRCHGDLREDYLEHVPCLNKAAEELSGCNKEMTVLLEATAKLEKRKHMLAHSCCSIQNYAQCMEKRAMTKCSKQAGEFAKGIILRVGESLLDGVCGKFTPDSEDCTNLPKPAEPETLRYRSFVPAMINVLQHYG